MPFNTLKTSTVLNRNLYDDQGNALANTNPRYNEALYGFNEKNNFYFGVYATAEFYQPVGGQVNGQDMVYEFTGDDDMVVYIDGVLVLDLGGIHDAQSGYINFANGEVGYTDHPTDSVDLGWTYTTIKKQFEVAGAIKRTKWKGNTNTFADGSKHKIQIFYMERGAGASNLKLKVNIPPIPDGSVTIEKQVEGLNKVQAENETYQLRVLTKEAGTETEFQPLKNYPYSLLAKKGLEGDKGKTDENGYLQIKAGDVEQVTFSGLKANTTFKVVESIPNNYNAIYKAAPEEVKIPNYTDDGIAVNVPAAGNALVTVTNTPKETGRLTINHEFLIDGVQSDTAPNPETFNNATFTLLEVGKNGKEDVNLGTKQYSSFENKSYTFEQLDKTKNYKVVADITDVTNGGTTAIPYQSTSYKIGSADQEKGKVANNISLQNGNETVTFIHVYQTPTADVTFTKVDAEDTTATLANAVFALYTDPKATIPYTKDGEKVTAPANANGVVTFTGLPYDSVSGKTYYIKEITAPTGYVLSDTIYTAQITLDENGPIVSITGNGTIKEGNVTKIQNTPVKLTFYKKANDSDQTPLKGATIKIEKKGENNTYQPVTNLTSVDNDGKFPIPKDGTTFNKMPDGEYRITEVTAPAGYNLLTKSFEFSISDGRLVQSTASSDEQVKIETPKDGTINITIFNTPGRVLPGTGGMGTFLYNLSGLALMLTALVYIIHARHRQKGGLN